MKAKGGYRANSGRKSEVDEKTRALVISKAWDRILKKFEKKNLTPEDEKQLDYISIELAKKTIPQNIDLQSGGKPLPIIQLDGIIRTNNGNEQNNILI